MTQNMEKYYGFQVNLTENLDPEKIDQLKEAALRIMNLHGYNPQEYLIYCHQILLKPDPNHWAKKMSLDKRVKSIKLAFIVNHKQQPKGTRQGRICFYNWLFDSPIEDMMGMPLGEHVEFCQTQYEIDYTLDNDFIKTHSHPTFKNVIITFIDRKLRLSHRKIKVHVTADPTEYYKKQFRNQESAESETYLDCYFTKSINLLPPPAVEPQLLPKPKSPLPKPLQKKPVPASRIGIGDRVDGSIIVDGNGNIIIVNGKDARK